MLAVSGGTHCHQVLPVMREQRCLPLIAPLSLQLPLASSSVLEPPLRFITPYKAERGLHREAAPPVGDSPGKMTDSFTVHTSQKQGKDFPVAPGVYLREKNTGLVIEDKQQRGGEEFYLGQLLQ